MKQSFSSSRVLAVVLLNSLLLLHQQQTDAADVTAEKPKTEAPTLPQKSFKKESPKPPPQLTQPEQSSQQKQATETDKKLDETTKQPTKAKDEEKLPPGPSIELTDSFPPLFYMLVGITTTAILLLVARVYRLRLSRAERKYGVQGDRANQELTPLPMAIEDVNTDEDEDHTLFDVNRHSIRIL